MLFDGATPGADAYAFAKIHAASLCSIQVLKDGRARVILEQDDPRPVAPIEESWDVLQALPEELELINAKLVKAGWPDMSPWWRLYLARAYFSGCRHGGVRAGRRAGKSTTICRVAVYETIAGDHDVPPGDIGVYGIVSAERPQAKDRIDTIAKILEVLGIEHKALKESIELRNTNREIRTFTASKQGVVGCTSIGWLLDEMSRWRDNEDGNNPAEAVIKSLTPTCATMPNAKIWWISSPWSTLDEHYKMIERGSNEHQIVAMVPTWVANPTISEADTHALEQDEPTRLREYAAIPMSGDETKFFNAALITEACVPFERRAA